MKGIVHVKHDDIGPPPPGVIFDLSGAEGPHTKCLAVIDNRDATIRGLEAENRELRYTLIACYDFFDSEEQEDVRLPSGGMKKRITETLAPR